MSLSEGPMGGGREKKSVRDEKYWNNQSMYEYNMTHCTVSYWISGWHDDREWVNNGGVG
jgi:hypothetical protein